MDPKWNLSEEEWKLRLSKEEYHVLREKGTEHPFSGHFHSSKEDGIYTCAACDAPLFDAKDKFDSKTGWPSYTRPANEESVSYAEDRKLFRTRTEVLCARCGSHLGHVFDDGPEPTGKRYCINDIAMHFKKRK